MLITQFRSYVQQENLFNPSQTVLLAVSGGADSVAMAYLFKAAGLRFGMAHCNFQLRGEESLRDAHFVEALSLQLDVPFFSIEFETLSYAERHKISIQVAARQLRYDWLEQVRAQEAYDYIATAHHLQDNVETLLMNLSKGTGIAGLHGILPRQGKLVRPLLFTDKASLLTYLDGRPFVEDSSNLTDKYTRNHFRQHVIPAIQEVFPQAVTNMGQSIRHFREAEQLYQQAIAWHRKKLLVQVGPHFQVSVLKLQKAVPLHTIAFELFAPFGCTPAQTTHVLQLLQAESGHFVDTPTHRILRNRAWLLILPHTATDNNIYVIDHAGTKAATADGTLHVSPATPYHGKLPTDAQNPLVACLDASQLKFPLLLRKWKTGDYFYPLGMTKKKKLSRFFIDQKLSLARKEQVWVVESNKRIVWIAGLRIDNRFKLTDSTRDMVELKWVAG
ncbi:tRNA lysidine(34) synthetase TilS [Chitinophaga parva]|uniref:tRNA(Ile)-lysidine synthase n=1 Tax=Chitinophaga parva TaxID=2169414 RepID=A0A2T7BDM7_9BACT|nr:tRNA lysidine(34) synthetase TilS [Chitinophaga parva]PUZ23199.1 tRNA lysidine(34) synthetase TilS [Chitinophaga parva]